MTTLRLLSTCVVALAGLLTVTLVVIGLRKTWRNAADVRRERFAAQMRPRIIGLLADEADVAAAIATLPAGRADLLEETIVAMVPKLRGEASERLVEVLRARGSVRRALRRLERPGAIGRARAAELLGRAAVPEAVEPLIGLLDDRSAAVRIVAAQALAGVPTPAAARHVLDHAGGPRSVPAGIVAGALLRMGGPAIPVVLAGAENGTQVERRIAVDVLGLAGDPRAVPVVTEAAQDAQAVPELRAAAARALGRLGSPAGVPSLLDCTRAESALVRAAAAAALGQLAVADTVPALRTLLYAEDTVAANAANALALTGTAGRTALEETSRHAGPDGPTRAATHAAQALVCADLLAGTYTPRREPALGRQLEKDLV